LNALTRAIRDDFHQQQAATAVQLKVDLDPYGTF
jgi:hypothetical protein